MQEFRTMTELPLIGGAADGQRREFPPDAPLPQTVDDGAYELFAFRGDDHVYYGYRAIGMSADAVTQRLFAWYRRT